MQEISPHKKFQTPERPYNYEDLFKAVEADLEDIIEEMRNKVKIRTR